jgi:hypothetical protein
MSQRQCEEEQQPSTPDMSEHAGHSAPHDNSKAWKLAAGKSANRKAKALNARLMSDGD